MIDGQDAKDQAINIVDRWKARISTGAIFLPAVPADSGPQRSRYKHAADVIADRRILSGRHSSASKFSAIISMSSTVSEHADNNVCRRYSHHDRGRSANRGKRLYRIALVSITGKE